MDRAWSDKGVRVLLSGRMPIHAVTPQQAARTWIGKVGWQGWRWRAPDQQQILADGYGVQMVSGHGVKEAIELGQGDTFHTHYCDMSSACKVRRGKSEVLVGESRSKPASAGLGVVPSSRARHSVGSACPRAPCTVPGAWDHGDVQTYPSCIVQGSTHARRCHLRSLLGFPHPLQDHSKAHTAPRPGAVPVLAGTPVPSP